MDSAWDMFIRQEVRRVSQSKRTHYILLCVFVSDAPNVGADLHSNSDQGWQIQSNLKFVLFRLKPQHHTSKCLEVEVSAKQEK